MSMKWKGDRKAEREREKSFKLNVNEMVGGNLFYFMSMKWKVGRKYERRAEGDKEKDEGWKRGGQCSKDILESHAYLSNRL